MTSWEIKIKRVLIKSRKDGDQEGFRVASENPFYEEFVYTDLEEMIKAVNDHFTLGLDKKEQ